MIFNIIRKTIILSSISLCFTLFLQYPRASAHGTTCSSMLREAFRTNGQLYVYGRYRAYGSAVSVRGTSGFQSFTMASNYQVEDGLANRSAASRSYFEMDALADGRAIRGYFVMVFPNRGNRDEDRSTLTIFRNGNVEIILNKWGNTHVPLSNVSCMPGHQGEEFILFGTSTTPSHGTTAYSFVIEPCLGSRGCKP